MAEFAFSTYQTVGAFLPGHTRNPYDSRRVPARSSGGTAAAVASNLGAIGLGTDSGNSIRGPSSHTALVGIRSTMDLTSRDGIVPFNLFVDIGGPMARTVEDAVHVFDVIAGHDPADPASSPARPLWPWRRRSTNCPTCSCEACTATQAARPTSMAFRRAKKIPKALWPSSSCRTATPT